MRNLPSILLAAAALAFVAGNAHATPLALSYSVGVGAGGGALETFDGMGPSGTRTPGVQNGVQWDSYWGVSLQGFATDRYDALLLPAAVSNGAYNGGLAAGLPGDSDRSLGFYLTNNGTPTRQMTARFTNATGLSLSAFQLVFDVEYWIQRSSPRWGGIQAFVSVNGTTFVNLGNSFESTLVNTANSGWVDGNAAANSTRGVGGSVDLAALGLPAIAPGASFYLRFDGTNGLTTPPAPGGGGFSNRNVGAFVDNLWVGTTARPAIPPIPEPDTATLVGAGLVALALSPRSRRTRSTVAVPGH